MPSPRVPRIGKPFPACPPRAQRLADLMAGGHSWKEAAALMVPPIKLSTATSYRRLPGFDEYYNQALADRRNGELGKNISKAIEIRDRPIKSAADGKTALAAIQSIEQRDGPPNVNVNVGVGVDIRPGYLVDVTEHVPAARRLLELSKSARSVIDATPSDRPPPVEPAVADRGPWSGWAAARRDDADAVTIDAESTPR